MKKLTIALLASLLAGSAFAAAGDKDKESNVPENLPKFAKADSNGDKKLTWKEAQKLGIPKSVFDDEDYDGDGTISKITYKYGIKEATP